MSRDEAEVLAARIKAEPGWHGEEDGETLCRSCRMAMAKDGRLPKGLTVYGQESEKAMLRRVN